MRANTAVSASTPPPRGSTPLAPARKIIDSTNWNPTDSPDKHVTELGNAGAGIDAKFNDRKRVAVSGTNCKRVHLSFASNVIASCVVVCKVFDVSGATPVEIANIRPSKTGTKFECVRLSPYDGRRAKPTHFRIPIAF